MVGLFLVLWGLFKNYFMLKSDFLDSVTFFVILYKEYMVHIGQSGQIITIKFDIIYEQALILFNF